MPLFGTKVGLNTAAINAGTALADGDYISGVFKTYITEADLQSAAVSQNANRFKTGQIVYISGSNKLYIMTSSFDDNAGESSIFSSSFQFPGAGSTNTGSLLITASVAGSTMTFTKGDGSTFSVALPSGGGNAFPYTGSAIISGSLIVTGSSFFTGSINANSITSSFQGDLVGTASIATTAINATSASYVIGGNVSGAVTSSISASYIQSSNIYGPLGANSVVSASYALSASVEIIKEVSSSYADTASVALDAVESGTVSLNTLTFTRGNGSTFDLTVDTGSGGSGIFEQTGSYYATTNDLQVTGSINATSITSSFSGSFTGDLTGTASIATTAINANTASYVVTAQTASYVIGANVDGAVTSSISASYIQSSNVYGPLGANSVVSASYALSASVEIIKEVSSSYAETASVALDAVESGTVSLNTLTFTKGNGSTFDLTVDTGSAGSGAGFPFSGSAVITGSLVVSGSGAIPIQASGQSINIGTPSDTTYTDGFFDTFTSATSLANAIDEISEAFLDLAPAKAGVLTSQNLSNPSSVDGYLAAGLFADEWYVGYSAHQEVPIITSNSVTLSTPSTSTIFRAGKNSDLVANTLEGGVTGSITYASTSPVLSIRALTAGTGTTDNINITSLAQYNTFWVKANAQIPHTITATNTGSYKYAVSADNGAGTTNTRQVFWVGTTAQNYPNQTVTPGTVTSASVTYNFLSGIQYLKTATFTIPMTADNMFNPVYNLNNVTFISSYFSNLTTGTQGSDTPSFNDQLSIPGTTRDLSSNTNSAQSAPTAQIRVIKPGKNNVTSNSFNISHTPVNSYASAQSTATVEYFLDEDKRDTGFTQTAWTPSATLTTGNLQVQNGRLITGNTGDYSGFTGAQYYYRTFSGYSEGGSSGDFDFDNGSNVFSSIGAWGSGADLEMIILKPEDVSAGVPTKIYDFGRAQANAVAATGVAVPGGTADVYGIKLGSVGGLSGTGDNGWSFGTNTTIGNSGELILLIKYSSTNETKQLNQLSITT